MEIRKAKTSEIKEIKQLVDKFEEMDIIKETFPETYYRRILQKGILLVAVENLPQFKEITNWINYPYPQHENAYEDLKVIYSECNSMKEFVGKAIEYLKE